jgi:hypothetical protein
VGSVFPPGRKPYGLEETAINSVESTSIIVVGIHSHQTPETILRPYVNINITNRTKIPESQVQPKIMAQFYLANWYETKKY